MSQDKYKSFGVITEKWLQCVIIGKKISVEQAKEVLAKTDSFFVYGYGSNEQEYDIALFNIVGRPIIDYADTYDQFAQKLDILDEFKIKNKLVELSYLYNSQISSCYIAGTHGWCHPNGTIFFNDNIGKWPEWKTIHEDCKKIAHTFPFLDIKVYIFNQEASSDKDSGEDYDYPRKCIGGFSIKNGRCRLLKESECISPNDENVIKHRSLEDILFGKVDNQKVLEKLEIFGDNADLSILYKTNEIFFNVKEFKEYFNSYFSI